MVGLGPALEDGLLARGRPAAHLHREEEVHEAPHDGRADLVARVHLRVPEDAVEHLIGRPIGERGEPHRPDRRARVGAAREDQILELRAPRRAPVAEEAGHVPRSLLGRALVHQPAVGVAVDLALAPVPAHDQEVRVRGPVLVAEHQRPLRLGDQAGAADPLPGEGIGVARKPDDARLPRRLPLDLAHQETAAIVLVDGVALAVLVLAEVVEEVLPPRRLHRERERRAVARVLELEPGEPPVPVHATQPLAHLSCLLAAARAARRDPTASRRSRRPGSGRRGGVCRTPGTCT